METRPEFVALARRLQGWPDLAGWMTWWLDAARPLAVLGAQSLYLTEPVLSAFFEGSALRGLAEALEDPAGLDRLRSELEEVA